MFDIKDFLIEGKIAENKIINGLKSALSSSKEEDIKKGIDFKITHTFDIKTAKKIRRKDDNVSYDYIWLEWKNVNGDIGSIQKTTIDYFVFERKHFWDVRTRESTFELFKISSKLNDRFKDLKILNGDTKVELYQPYQRYNRKDVIMLVELDNVNICSTWGTPNFIIPKSVFNQ